ncbi:MAG TPA: hypothetical protein VKY33_07755 [Flavobacterium sp.]|nr:hypothetical protein [Flavobacterium sp.]
MNEFVIKSGQKTTDRSKYRLLLWGLLLDAVGMLSFTIPFIGAFSDIIWAPIAGLLLKSMYKGTIGKVGGIVVFFEELLPGTDVIPTFTLAWIYTYLIQSKK